MKRTIALLLLLVIVLVPMMSASAAETAKVTKIYGTETLAFDCKSFDEFYAGNFFVWFQVDLDITSKMTGPLMNQQVLGDAILKKAANDKIKLNGLTIRQINAQSGNPYGAMIAFEPTTGPNDTTVLRVSIWLSWGSTAVQDLFKKETTEYFTFEFLSGMQVPGTEYTRVAPTYADVTPVKYRIPLATLEFKTQPSNSGYTEEKKDWVKPMFEEFTAKWQLFTSSSNTPTPSATSAATATPTSDAGVTPIATPEATPGATGSETSPTPEATAPAEGTPTTAPTEAPADGGTFPVLPVVLGAAGFLVIGGGLVYFLKVSKKA